MRPVTMYMCSAECSGTVTPHDAARPALAHWPAQLMTTSALMSPRVVATPVATPFFWWIAVTRVCSKMRAPPMRAPLRERLRHVGRIDLGVVGQPERAEQIVGAHHRIFSRRLLDRDDLAGDALRARRGRQCA